MPTHANALAVMAKAPIAGSVKTRMVPPLTHDEAAELCRALLLDQLDHLSSFSDVDLYVAFAPEHSGALIKDMLPAGFELFAQPGGDLGARMNGVLAELWRRGHRCVAIIGSDVPAVPLTILRDAFRALQSDRPRVVLGPSRDGGYYLIGMNRPTPEVFNEMSWSHEHVFSQTAEKLASLGIEFATLPCWFDLDSVDDIEFLRSRADHALRTALKRTVDFFRSLDRWDFEPPG